MKEKIERTEAEWRLQLTEQQYQVTREAATEAPFTGQYDAPKPRASTVARVVDRICSVPRPSTIPALAGRASGSLPARAAPHL